MEVIDINWSPSFTWFPHLIMAPLFNNCPPIQYHSSIQLVPKFKTIWRGVPSSYGCHFLKGCCRAACCLNNGHSIKVIQRMFIGVCFVLGVFSEKAFRRLNLPHGSNHNEHTRNVVVEQFDHALVHSSARPPVTWWTQSHLVCWHQEKRMCCQCTIG